MVVLFLKFGDESVRELIARSYRIVYRVKRDEYSIEIIRFWHAGRERRTSSSTDEVFQLEVANCDLKRKQVTPLRSHLPVEISGLISTSLVALPVAV